MNKPYGAQGQIINFPFQDLHETFYNQDGIEIEVRDGILSVGVDDKSELEEAKQLARLYIAAWSERQNFKITVDFNHTWQTNLQGQQHHQLEVVDHIGVSERLQIISTTHQISIPMTASLVTQQMYDSASFTNDTAIWQKAQKYPTLKSAIFYYSEEVVDDERPLYGIYKALEAITSFLHKNEKVGRKLLAQLAGQSFSYVDDVMQTTQIKRHHKTSSTRKISDEECRQRAKILIDAFASSLPYK